MLGAVLWGPGGARVLWIACRAVCLVCVVSNNRCVWGRVGGILLQERIRAIREDLGWKRHPTRDGGGVEAPRQRYFVLA